MSNLTPHQKSALEFAGNISLTANAGSGKTFVLARRYLNAALNPGINLSSIAAITFTDKASGELYNKIVSLVNEAMSLTTSDSERKKLDKIRRQLVSANISTIHSFCINILKEFPVEAGLDARFIPIDEQLADELIELAIEETIKKLLDDNKLSEYIKYLIRIFGSKSRLESELKNLIKQRKNLLAVKNSIYNNDAHQIVKHFEEQFDHFFKNIWNGNKDSLLSSLKIINDTVMFNDKVNELASVIRDLLTNLNNVQSGRDILKNIYSIRNNIRTKAGTLRVKGYLTGKLKIGLEKDVETLESSLEEFSKFAYHPDANELNVELAEFGLKLIQVFEQVLVEYENKKNAEGFLDYEDILLHTKFLLKTESVKKSLNEKFKYILVDEYQDTNEIQYEIFLPILDYLKTGNLFIVGDEKQSIYMFRDAELEIFSRTKKDISSQSGSESLLELPDSFRMAPSLCLFSNSLFESLFINPNENFNEVKNTNIVCARNDDNLGKIEFLLADLEQGDGVPEAGLVARRIIDLYRNGTSFNDIAILVRKRKSFAELENEFIKYGIPYSIIGGRGFYQRQTISDVFNYLSFLSNSSNSTALVGTLRSPFFTLPDSLLFEVSLLQGENFWVKLRKYSDAHEELQKTVSLLEENLQLASSSELTILLRKILSDTEYLAVIASRNDGEQELSNIEKLIDISRVFSNKGFRNLYDFISFLGDAIKGIEDESQAAITTDSNAIQLMTVHQAKGLEFPVVFLFKTHESSQKTLIKSKQVSVSKKFGILTKLPLKEEYLNEYQSTPINDLYDYIEEKKRIAELKRLLYVAITRAKDHLIISGEYDEEKLLKKDSFLGLITEGLEIDFSSDHFLLNGKLDYLEHNGKEYSGTTRNLDCRIPILKSIPDYSGFTVNTDKLITGKTIHVKKLLPPIEKDFISATKVAVYNQCPTKYLLTYEFGFKEINNLHGGNEIQNINYDFNQQEDDIEPAVDDEVPGISIPGNIKGTLQHLLLEREITPENLDVEITNHLIKEGFSGDSLSESKKRIISEMQHYYSSDIYRELSNCENYKNEFEVYLKENGTYLYGIMDKIIFNGEELIIVDYKTDDISVDEIQERAENYLIQLKFYLYLAQKLFSNYKLCRLILIFIKHPDTPYVKKINYQDFSLVKREISDIIKGINHKIFFKNTKHCAICTYSDNNKKCKMISESERVFK